MAKPSGMRRLALIGVLVAALATAAPALGSPNPRIAALQVALRAQRLYSGPVDGLSGPLTKAGLVRFQKRHGLMADGKIGPQTRCALGRLGKPLLGRRELWAGRSGWDVSSLEFRLRRWGLPAARVDGRFDAATSAALRRFQRSRGLAADGVAGARTFRALLTRRPRAVRRTSGAGTHVVRPGESFFAIAQRYHVSPWTLAQSNGLRLGGVLLAGRKLRLPGGASTAAVPEDRAAVRASLDRWSAHYGVDPSLARALAWMESGFQNHVVSSVGAVGVMQLLPGTWEWVEMFLIGHRVPRTADGNVRIGVRFLRWQLDHFGGDVRLALAGWYQGARAVRERGLFDDTKQFVSVVQSLYGRI